MENQTNNAAQPIKSYFKRYPVGRVIIACLVGILVGSFQPMMLMMSMTLCVMPIVLCALYAWAGLVPAAVSAAVTLLSTASGAQLLGIDPMLLTAGALLLMIAPAAAMIYATEKRMKFFHRLAVGIGAHIAALLIGVTVVYAGLKIDLVETLTASMRAGMDLLPAGSVTVVLEQFNMYGLLTEESLAEISSGFVTNGDIAKVLDQGFDNLTYMLKQVMLAAVLSSGLISGMLITAVTSRIRRDCGYQTADEHVMVDYWRMPPSVVGMLAAGTAAGYIMQLSGVSGSESLTMVFMVLTMELLVVQGIAAISRGFREVNASAVSRLGLIAASLLLMPSFLEMVGIFSLLMGREGVIRKWMKKRIEQRESEDDEE